MFVRFYRFGIPLVALALAQPLSAQAPASASLAASAQVISPVTIAATHPLDFGRAVSGGSSKTVAPNAAGGGRVEVYGAAGNTVTISMSMPAALKNTGADAIAVTGWNFMLSQSATLTGATTVPFSGITASVAASPDGTTGMGRLYLAIGATVQALATSPAGAYSGTGQVTVAYADL